MQRLYKIGKTALVLLLSLAMAAGLTALSGLTFKKAAWAGEWDLSVSIGRQWDYVLNSDGQSGAQDCTLIRYLGSDNICGIPANITSLSGETYTVSQVGDASGHFPGDYLISADPNITGLDFSDCGGNLTTVTCCSSRITYLKVTSCTALTYLNCSGCQLGTGGLNVTYNTALTTLNCSHCGLTSLDISDNTALTTLNCSYNKIPSLDISTNDALKTCVSYHNLIKVVGVLVEKFGAPSTIPQDCKTDYIPTAILSKADFSYTTSRSYNKKSQPAGVKSNQYAGEVGAITTYYEENGHTGMTTSAPYKADRYGLYVKTTAGTLFAPMTSYLYIGSYTIVPHAAGSLKASAGNNKLVVSWHDYSTSADNVSYYRVYYKKSGGSWKYKTCKGRSTHKATLSGLSNKKKYYVKVRVYRSVSGSDVASTYSSTVSKTTK